PLASPKARIDYTRAGLIEKDVSEDWILVVGKMQAVEDKSITSGYRLAKKWSSNIPKGCVSVGSKACSELVQFINRATGIGKKRIRSTNKIGNNQGAIEMVLKRGKLLWQKDLHRWDIWINEVFWIPSEMNLADKLTRVLDEDNWCMSQTIFDYIEEKWGPYTIDRLVKGKQLHLPTYRISLSGFALCNRGKSSGNNNCTQVGFGSMVAIATACSDKLYISGSKSELFRKLLVRAQALSKKSVLNNWNRHLAKAYVDILTALSREYLEHHLADPSKNYRVKRICKALVKEDKKDKEPK
ncbi:44135_t:CDS:2, partial [Gigaspora margarita]